MDYSTDDAPSQPATPETSYETSYESRSIVDSSPLLHHSSPKSRQNHSNIQPSIHTNQTTSRKTPAIINPPGSELSPESNATLTPSSAFHDTQPNHHPTNTASSARVPSPSSTSQPQIARPRSREGQESQGTVLPEGLRQGLQEVDDERKKLSDRESVQTHESRADGPRLGRSHQALIDKAQAGARAEGSNATVHGNQKELLQAGERLGDMAKQPSREEERTCPPHESGDVPLSPVQQFLGDVKLERRRLEEIAARKRREEVERQEQEDANRKHLEHEADEAAERKRREMAERNSREEETKRKRKDQEEEEELGRQQQKTAERERREETERKRPEEAAERKRREQEASRRRQEDAEQRRREEAERKRQEQETSAELKRREEVEHRRQASEAADLERRKEAERKRQKEEAERRRQESEAAQLKRREDETERRREAEEAAHKRQEEELERRRQEEEAIRKQQKEAERRRREKEAVRKRQEEEVERRRRKEEVERMPRKEDKSKGGCCCIIS